MRHLPAQRRAARARALKRGSHNISETCAINRDDLTATVNAMTRFAGRRPVLELQPAIRPQTDMSAAFWQHTPRTSRLAGHRLHILALTVRGASQVDQIVNGRCVWRGPISTSVTLLRQHEESEWHMEGPFEQLQVYLDLSEFPHVGSVSHLKHPFRDDVLLHLARSIAFSVREGCTSNSFLSPFLEALKQAFVERHLSAAALGYAGPRNGGLSGPVRLRLEELIRERLGSRITTQDLADCAQLSPGHFNRAFRQVYGMSPHKYLTDRRIELASRLLGETDMPVSKIAAETGFASPSHFGAVFRRETGQCPHFFRRVFAASARTHTPAQ